AVHVARGDVGAAGEVGVEGEELLHQGAGAAVVDVDVRSAARPRGRQDIGEAVAVDVAGRHADAAGVVDVVGHEVEQHVVAVAVKGHDVRTAAGVGAGDVDVRGVHPLAKDGR